MMMTQLISNLGAEVSGPFGALTEALDSNLAALDAAVLDVNVAGELIYPLAERLASMGTPMVFLTGYDAKSIDQRFHQASVLTKPIDEVELANCLAGMFDRTPIAQAATG
jgi:DNA-binding LytR/AlgR family response regulator